MIEVTVTGLAEVHAALEQFSYKVQRKVVIAGLRAGSMMLRTALRQAAPVRQTGGGKKMKGDEQRMPGFLKKKLTFKLNRRQPRGQLGYRVGPFGQAYYGYFVETGHAAGKRKKYGRGVTEATGLKMVPAHPFIMPTFTPMQMPITNKIVNVMQEGIAKAAAEAGFKPAEGTARL